jgi:hypothetical protein
LKSPGLERRRRTFARSIRFEGTPIALFESVYAPLVANRAVANRPSSHPSRRQSQRAFPVPHNIYLQLVTIAV